MLLTHPNIKEKIVFLQIVTFCFSHFEDYFFLKLCVNCEAQFWLN